MPSEITSTPASFFSRTLRSSSANRYGGSRSRRLLGCMQLRHQLVAHVALVYRPGPAGQLDLQIFADGHLQLAAVEADRDRAGRPAQHRRDSRAGCAGAGRHGLPHPALEDTCSNGRVALPPPERHVRAAREQLVALDGGAVERQVELLQPVVQLDRALGVAGPDELELELALGGRQGAAAVLGPGGEVLGRLQAHPPHLDRAGVVAGDAGPDLARDGAHGEAVVLGPAVSAQVHDGLAYAVAGQLGLGAVRIEDAQLGYEVVVCGLTQQQHAVGADARVRGAQDPYARRRELERKLPLLDDGVVVAERLPLLEAHGRARYPEAGCPRSYLCPENEMTCWMPVGRLV